jgi:hypothetical protein
MESVLSAGQPSARVDARPILPRTSENIWSQAERERDRLYDLLAHAAFQAGIEPLLLKSPPFVFPLWVKIEFWMPSQESCTDRAGATIVVEPKPCHAYEFEYGITYAVNGKQKSVKRIQSIGLENIDRLVRFLLRQRTKPVWVRFRERGSWAIWRPKNEINRIRTDYLSVFGILLIMAGFSLVSSIQAVDDPRMPVLLLGLLLGGGILALWRSSHRPLLVHCAGKPDGEPRSLVRVDSWQTVIFGLGDRESFFRSLLLAQLASPPTERFRWHVEKVWYWGLDGKEEREQIVLSLGRGLVYCQIYQYGKDLYIGWDGNVNYGQWVEQQVGKGIDKKTRRLTAIMSVVPGTQAVSEYDLIDLNCLMEWTHAQMVKLAKNFISELKIDQEIDFKILRGDRQGITGEKKDTVKDRLKTAFKRVG